MSRDSPSDAEHQVIERYSLFYLEKPARTSTLVDTIVDQLAANRAVSSAAVQRGGY